MTTRLLPAAWSDLSGFDADDHFAAFSAYLRVAKNIASGRPAVRAARPATPAAVEVARRALYEPATDATAAKAFFRKYFRPFLVVPEPVGSAGFLTGYYEPKVKGSKSRTPWFTAPIRPRPLDLVSFSPGEGPPGFPENLAGARRRRDDELEPYPTRAEIEDTPGQVLVWVSDAVEAFMIHIQGSAVVELPDGKTIRLSYDGRNGRPYTSIGRALIAAGEISESEMSLERLKSWLHEAGLGPGQLGRETLRRNESYIFFKAQSRYDPSVGPVGGAGVPLTPLRSLAVDRDLWSYGTPFWIEAVMPWKERLSDRFRRLMIADDTGSAIIGGARGDVFFGSGDAAGERAGSIRHPGAFIALLPEGEKP